jgi:gluconokinase
VSLVLVLMGVSGCGKSTIGAALAERLGWPFKDGDELHPPQNLAKMAHGQALEDADREPWLIAIGAQIDAWQRDARPGVIACSALRRCYRELIIGRRSLVRLIYLKVDQALVQARLALRRGHFMPASLLQSQFALLEEPAADESAIVLDASHSPQVLVDDIIHRIGMEGTT